MTYKFYSLAAPLFCLAIISSAADAQDERRGGQERPNLYDETQEGNQDQRAPNGNQPYNQENNSYYQYNRDPNQNRQNYYYQNQGDSNQQAPRTPQKRRPKPTQVDPYLKDSEGSMDN